MNKTPPCQVVRELLLEKKEHTVAGTSMRPFLKHGQKVTLSDYATKLVIGHVYVFIYNSKLVLHRLVTLHGNFAFFMGDNSYYLEKVPYSAIIAHYECAYRNYRLAIINFLNKVCYSFEKNRIIFKVSQRIRIKCITLLLWRGKQ